MNYLRKNFVLIVLTFLFSISLESQADVTSGQPAPNFTLSDTNGKNHSLSNFQGKFVVLEWTNHDCPFVRKHYDSQNMQNLQKAYTGKGVVWLTINSSAPGKQGHFSPETWNELTKTKGASPTAVLLDTDGKVGKMYGAQTTPHMYVIDPKGTLVYQGAIDSTPSADSDDIPKSKNYTQAALDESMAGKNVSTPSTKSYGCSVKY
jgi:peroxiredoxin